MHIYPGTPSPLGATWDGAGVNFALFSAHATKVELCLFDMDGERELERIELPEYTDEVWHGFLPDARPGTIYAYRVHVDQGMTKLFEPDKKDLLDRMASTLALGTQPRTATPRADPHRLETCPGIEPLAPFVPRIKGRGSGIDDR